MNANNNKLFGTTNNDFYCFCEEKQAASVEEIEACIQQWGKMSQEEQILYQDKARERDYDAFKLFLARFMEGNPGTTFSQASAAWENMGSVAQLDWDIKALRMKCGCA